jgi:hypothetical protein
MDSTAQDTEHPPKEATYPQAGDAVRLLGFWYDLEPGDIGVIGGYVGQRQDEASITFRASTYRATARDGEREIVSCSGGPATIATDLSELRPTEERHTLTVWRFKDGGIRGAGRDEGYPVQVAVWDWLPAGARVPDRPLPERRFGPVPAGTATHRGDHPLAHQPRQIQRDLDGEKIAANFGRTASGYRLTAQQVQDRRDGKPGATGLPYEYLIYDPRSAGTSWTAFYNRGGLAAWMAAYDLSIEPEPEPGQRFTVQLPDDDSRWQPLRTCE